MKSSRRPSPGPTNFLSNRRVALMFDRLCRVCGFGAIVIGILGVSFYGALSAQEKTKNHKATPAKESKDSGTKAPTYKIKREPFKIEVSLKGIFESADMTEVALRPQAWGVEGRGSLSVLKAVEQGTMVHKGDTLVTLDFEKIDQAIRELENERRFAELTLNQTEAELPVLEKSVPLDLAIAERQKKIADEDLKRFFDIEKPFMQRMA